MAELMDERELDADALAELRSQLVDERAHLLAQAGLSEADLVDPEDPTLGHDHVTTAIETMASSALSDIASALARIDAGEYGRCLDCGTAIPVERLEIMPAARYCVGCQQTHE